MKNLTPQLLHTVTKQLLNGRANVTLGAWKESLQRHPQHPSMQSLADTLQRWGFDNAALRLVPEQLAELPYPYIAHFREQGGKFVGVLDRKEDRLHTTDGLTEDWIELGAFEKSWSGAVLLVEPKEKNGDPDYSHKRKVEILQSLRLPTLIGAFTVLILSALVLTPSFSLLAALYVVLSMAGLGLSIALVSLNLEGKNSPAQKLCQTSDDTDCHSVLDSPSAKLLGIFSWAELGMLYFGFALVLLLTGMISQQVASTLNLSSRNQFLGITLRSLFSLLPSPRDPAVVPLMFGRSGNITFASSCWNCFWLILISNFVALSLHLLFVGIGHADDSVAGGQAILGGFCKRQGSQPKSPPLPI